MAVLNEKNKSLKFTPLEKRRLAWALALSFAAHFLVWGGYELGQKTGLWQRLHWPGHKQLAVKKIPPPVQDSDPTIFLDVDQATPEPPKNAKYYSAKSSRATQTDASRDANQPKLNGKQTDVPNARDVPRTPNARIQPAPAPQPPSQIKMAAPPPSMLQAGDIKLAKLETSPDKNDVAPERPRTVAEALAQKQAFPIDHPNIFRWRKTFAGRIRQIALPSHRMPAAVPSAASRLPVAFEFAALSWRKFARDRIGKVTLRFHLNYDGSVSDMEVLQNQVGDLLGYVCQKAVNDTQPYAKWPSDMRRMIGDNYRQITLTFIYY